MLGIICTLALAIALNDGLGLRPPAIGVFALCFAWVLAFFGSLLTLYEDAIRRHPWPRWRRPFHRASLALFASSFVCVLLGIGGDDFGWWRSSPALIFLFGVSTGAGFICALIGGAGFKLD